MMVLEETLRDHQSDLDEANPGYAMLCILLYQLKSASPQSIPTGKQFYTRLKRHLCSTGCGILYMCERKFWPVILYLLFKHAFPSIISLLSPFSFFCHWQIELMSLFISLAPMFQCCLFLHSFCMTQWLFGWEEPDKLTSDRSNVRTSHDLMSNWFNCKSEAVASSSATTSPTFTGLKERGGERGW